MEPRACNLEALSPEERARRAELFESVGRSVRKVEELPDGYRVLLHRDAASPGDLVELAGYERRCCPFLTFRTGEQPVPFFEVTGPADAKGFIEAEFGFRPGR